MLEYCSVPCAVLSASSEAWWDWHIVLNTELQNLAQSAVCVFSV